MDKIWEELFRTHEWGKYPPESVVRFVARNFYSAPERGRIRLLDAGCGPGACSWFMAREGFQVSGIDGSPSAIKYAKERLAAEGLEADFRVGDYTSMPWANELFDGAVAGLRSRRTTPGSGATGESQMTSYLSPESG